MQNNLCLQLVRKSSDVIVASLCKDSESDDDKDYYSQLWLFEQVSCYNNNCSNTP